MLIPGSVLRVLGRASGTQNKWMRMYGIQEQRERNTDIKSYQECTCGTMFLMNALEITFTLNAQIHSGSAKKGAMATCERNSYGHNACAQS